MDSFSKGKDEKGAAWELLSVCYYTNCATYVVGKAVSYSLHQIDGKGGRVCIVAEFR